MATETAHRRKATAETFADTINVLEKNNFKEGIVEKIARSEMRIQTKEKLRNEGKIIDLWSF